MHQLVSVSPLARNRWQKVVAYLTKASSIRDKGHQKTMHSEIKCIIKEESEKVLIKILNHCTLVFSSALLFVKHKNNMHKIRKCSWNLRNITNEKLIRGEDLIE